VQTNHQHLERSFLPQIGGAFAQQFDQFVVDDFDDLLARGDAFEHLLPNALDLHALDELAGDFKMDVGGEQGSADLFEGVCHICLGQLADAAKVAQGAGEFFGQAFEHGNANVSALRPATSGKYRLPPSIPTAKVSVK
jgi:hypothetical protein